MTARPQEVTTVYIAAVGGQGGALLCDWLLAAAHQMRYQAHSVGIPGMSQRGGATSYYVEMAPEGTSPGLDDALLSPAPFLGEIDCLVGLELLELGRAAEGGYSSEKTNVIGSTHRDYTILEKLPSYAEPRDEAKILALLERCSGRLVAFDAVALARAEGLAERHVNAILLGAVAAAGALPLREEAYRLAIKAVGVTPDLNLRAFEVGLHYTLAGLPELPADAAEAADRWREALSPAQRRAHGSLLESLPARINGELRAVLEAALARLIDYEDEAYARRYLQRTLALWEREEEAGRGARLTKTYARHAANLMTYEDPVRVAALKSDPRRFGQIEAKHEIRAGQTYQLRERFQPEAEELYGLLPAGLVRRFLKPEAESSRRLAVPVRLKTTSVVGMALLRGLASLKGLRGRSWRRRKEEALQDTYTGQVVELLGRSYELACLAAQAGGLIRGYGEVRRRTERLYETYIRRFLLPLANLDERLAPSGGYLLTQRAAAQVQSRLKPTGAGFDEAVALVEDLQAHAGERSYDELLEMVSDLKGPTDPSPQSPCCG